MAFTIGNFVDDTAKGEFTVQGLQVNGTISASGNASAIGGFNGTLTLASNSSVIDQYGNFTSTGGFFTVPAGGTLDVQIDQSPGYTWFAANGSSLGNAETDVNFKLQVAGGSPQLGSEFYGYPTSDNMLIIAGATGTGFETLETGENNFNATAVIALVNKGDLTPATSLTALQSGTWSFFTLAANASMGTQGAGISGGSSNTAAYAYRMGNLTVSAANVATVSFWDSIAPAGTAAGTAFEGTMTASADINGVTVQNASASNNLNDISYAGNWTIMANATLDANSEVFVSNTKFGTPTDTTAPYYGNGTQFTVALKGAELVDADADLTGTWKLAALGGIDSDSMDDMAIGNFYVDSILAITDGALFTVANSAATNTDFETNAGTIAWSDITINSDTFSNLLVKNSASAVLVNATGRLLNSSTKKLFVGISFDGATGLAGGLVFMTGTSSSAPQATIDVTQNNLTILGLDVGLGANSTMMGSSYWGITDPLTSDFFGFTGNVGADTIVMPTFNMTIVDPTGLTVNSGSFQLVKGDNATSSPKATQTFTYSTTLTDDVKINSNASLTTSDVGTWCLFDPAAAAQFCVASGSSLEVGKIYTVAYVVQEGSTWDLYSGDAGVLVDPVILANPAGGGGTTTSSSGCVLNPAAGFGLEWLLLLAAPLLAVLRNRFRK